MVTATVGGGPGVATVMMPVPVVPVPLPSATRMWYVVPPTASKTGTNGPQFTPLNPGGSPVTTTATGKKFGSDEVDDTSTARRLLDAGVTSNQMPGTWNEGSRVMPQAA